MKIFRKTMKNKSLGFTLIELLVVVAILGVLAVGVVALLNPAEKTNKAKDVANKNTASEIIGAYELYYMETGTTPEAGTLIGGATNSTLNADISSTLATGTTTYVKSSVLTAPLNKATNTTLNRTTKGVQYIQFQVYSIEYKKAAAAQLLDSATPAVAGNNAACGVNGDGTGICLYRAY